MYFERLSLFWVYLLLRLVEWKISPFWKKCHQMLCDVSFKWDSLTERKENVLVLGPVWSDLIMMIIYSPFICSPLHAPIWWDVAMGFSSQQLAGLVPGEQPWSGCPCQAALACQLLKKRGLFVRIRRVSLPLSCSWLWLSRFWTWPSNVLLLCDNSWCFPSQLLLPLLLLAAFLGLMAPAILAGVT